MKKLTIFIVLLRLLTLPARAMQSDWKLADWVIKDSVNEVADGSLDLCNVFCRETARTIEIKVTTRAPLTEKSDVRLTLSDKNGNLLMPSSKNETSTVSWKLYRGVGEATIEAPQNWQGLQVLSVKIVNTATGATADQGTVDMLHREPLDGQTGNCAFVHHGNQGLTYTDVFRGPGGATDKGFDEVLEVHDARNVPGNFHMSGTLITAAEWYDRTFNDWLRTGIGEGWVCMLTSAYAQHIMPFVQDAMNNWAVHTEHDLVNYVYNYEPHVAWVPERVWLASGHYPDAGIVDSWLGDNWQQHGIQAVILDDDPHIGNDNYWHDRKIHWMANDLGITLRLIPIDGEFTGNVLYDPGTAISKISSTTRYGLIVYGTDWEAAARMAQFTENCPSCLTNYIQVINWLGDNYPAAEAWKLDAALNNPDFNGSNPHEITCGTYQLLGGTGGYGGSNNSWYLDWANTISHSDYHSPAWNYGYIWDQVRQRLMSAPSNDCSESGWYVMMTNLHETGWHDNGQVSDWIHRYSSHIKNAAVYPEAAHWAAGEYQIPVNAYLSDIDLDGVNELVIHNDRIMAVFESIGGRAQWVFAKGSGYGYSVVGNDNAYWAETDGDYDEANSKNHQAAFADVDPNYRNDLYDLAVDGVTDSTAQIHFSHGGLTKTFRVKQGQPYLDVRYDTGDRNGYIQHGYTPDLVDMIWNADLTRIWPQDVAYMGYRNPNTGATGACILGNGGCSHGHEFSGTLLRGDEIHGWDRFGYLFYAGYTSAPDTQGRIAELEALKTQNLDHFSPKLYSPAVFYNGTTVEVNFSEAVNQATAQNTANWSLQGFPRTYNVTAAVRQSNWNKVRLTVSPTFVSGDSGTVVCSNVTDLNGNVVLPSNHTAMLMVPNGLTPHTIVIDGTRDFSVSSELIYGGTDTLFVTWDYDALYIGYYPRDLNTQGDFFINIDTNQTNNAGASRDSWDRVNFANPFRPEYQVAMEGGTNLPQLNRWTGTAWTYPGSGTPAVTSYNGWSGNLLTEVRIPWAAIGRPCGIAFTVHISQEDAPYTSRVFPPTNPTGTNVTFTQAYRLYPPYISACMPLMGVSPRNMMSADNISAPTHLTILLLSNGSRRLQWNTVTGVASYFIYRATSVGGTYSLIDEVGATHYDDTDVLPDARYFYRVTAKGGL
jgi:hypothetical protein